MADISANSQSVNDIPHSPQGTQLVLNGMSYSGADIKAIVHIYDGGTAAKSAIGERIRRLRQDLNDIQTQLEAIGARILEASGTPALATLNSGRISHLSSTKSTLLGNILDITQEINRLEDERPKISTKVLGEIQTLSVSTYREKVAVRALGHTYPKSYCRGCIEENEPIYTSKGYKPIKDINIGDMVLSYNFETQKTEYMSVTNKFNKGIQETYKVILKNGLSMNLTGTHRIYTNSGWKLLSEMTTSDSVYIPNGYLSDISLIEMPVADIQKNLISSNTYDLEIANNHNLFGTFLSHNSRTIAGSMIFAVMYQNVLEELLQSHPADFDMGTVTTALVDQLPPFDITIAFANEYGAVSRMAVMGVEFVNDGQTMSIEDMFLENVMQYVARDIDPMRQVGIHKKDRNNNLSRDFTQTGSALLLEEDYQRWRDKLNPFGRFNARNNPFI